MATITIDPVTRLEGHLKISLENDGASVTSARSSGTMFRGFENILFGKHPRDAVQITQRVCGVCPISHGVAASLAVEAAAGVRASTNARVIRNLILGAFLAAAYGDYYSIGRGYGNLLAFGGFDLDDAGTSKLLPRGRASNGSERIDAVETGAILEQTTWSWYLDSSANPASGVTLPAPGKDGAYSWLKAPRYEGLPFETGPLARMWMDGSYRNGISVMDRHQARVREALGHWLTVAAGKLANYQVLTPTCWNCSPRDAAGLAGPLEKALEGIPVADPQQPIEALRVVQSYDPCLACAVH